MASSVVAVCNSTTSEVVMIVVDAADLNDPSFNPADCIQVPLDAVSYNDAENKQDWIAAQVAAYRESHGV